MSTTASGLARTLPRSAPGAREQRTRLIYRRLIAFTTLVTLALLMMGAWVRLTDAGLGCPDWPGCYGHIGVPDATHEVAAAEAAYP